MDVEICRPGRRSANGLEITRDVGVAAIRSGDFKTVDEVVFGRTGDLALPGAHALEGFNASVDARRKRLVPSGPIPAARGARIVALKSAGAFAGPFWGSRGYQVQDHRSLTYRATSAWCR